MSESDARDAARVDSASIRWPGPILVTDKDISPETIISLLC